MVFNPSACMRGTSLAQAAESASGSVYWLLPVVEPLLEKSSAWGSEGTILVGKEMALTHVDKLHP
jgi:hypothetical protein